MLEELNQKYEIRTLEVNAQLTPALLVLQDGTVFRGTAVGKIGTTTGEICFNT